MNDFEYVEEDRISYQFKGLKRFISFIMILLAVIGAIYFIFWLMISVEDTIYDYAKHAMLPLPKLIFPDGEGYVIFKNTALVFILACAPLIILNILLDKLGMVLRKCDQFKKNLRIKEDIKKTEEEILKQFEKINKYSIAITLDYHCEKGISDELKSKLDKSIYAKLTGVLSILKGEAHTVNNEAFIITSKDFENFDNVYEFVLNILKKVSINLQNTYKLVVIPTIMTDAYNEEITLTQIKKRLFQVKELNFKNKSCSTMLFRKKYMHLNKSEYQGVPVGQYMATDKNKIETFYELNIITQNIVRTLNPDI